MTGPLDVLAPLLLPEELLLDAQAARRTAAAQAAADLLIVEGFTLVLLYPVRAFRRCRVHFCKAQALRLVSSTHAADVELHDRVVVEQFLCRTVEPVAPEHEDVAPVRVAEGAPGVLLNHADPDARGGDFLDLLP